MTTNTIAVQQTASKSTWPILKAVEDLYKPYIGLTRDHKLREAFEVILRNPTIGGRIPDSPDKRRIVGVCGQSGAGKTQAVLEAIRQVPQMQPYEDEDGVIVDPVLWFVPQSPSSPQNFAYQGLAALKFPVDSNMRESKIFGLFQTQLKVNRRRYIFVDECQDAIEAANRIELIKMANVFKKLVQIPDWPIFLILIGTPPLAEFLCRNQLLTRRLVVLFEPENRESVGDLANSIVKKVVVDHAKLRLGTDFPCDFGDRLGHANAREIGSIIQMARGAAELGLRRGDREIGIEHFVETYASFSGCEAGANVFNCAEWNDCDPFTAVLRDGDRDHVEVRGQSFNARTRGKGLAR